MNTMFPPYDPDAPFGSAENPLGKSEVDRALQEDEREGFPELPAGVEWAGNILGTAGHLWLEELALSKPDRSAEGLLQDAGIEDANCCGHDCSRGFQMERCGLACTGGFTKDLPTYHACITRLEACMAIMRRDYLPTMRGIKLLGVEVPARGVLTLDTGRDVHVCTVGIDLLYMRAAELRIDDYKFSPQPTSDESAQHDLYPWLVACGMMAPGLPMVDGGHHARDWTKLDRPYAIGEWPKVFRYVQPGAKLSNGHPLVRELPVSAQATTASLVRKVRRYLDKFPPPLRVAMPTQPQPQPQQETTVSNQRPAFKRATKLDARLRMALIGPAGSGKTYTALRIASNLGQRVAVIDTERGSASKYADEFEFDVVELASFNPGEYVEMIEAAQRDYDVLVIDSLSHAWAGPGGVLEFVDAKNIDAKNKYSAWRDATPLHNSLVNAIIAADCHIVATMRAKMEYVQEKDDRGKTVIRKVGLQPVQREGLEYEFDVIGDIDAATMTVSKTRCRALHDKRFVHPGRDVALILREWLGAGKVAPSEPAVKRPAQAPVEREHEHDGQAQETRPIVAGGTEPRTTTSTSAQEPKETQASTTTDDKMERARALWGKPKNRTQARQMTRLALNLEALGVPTHDMPGMLLHRARQQFGSAPDTVTALLDNELVWLITATENALRDKGIERPVREPDADERHEIAVAELIGEATQVKGGANGAMSSAAKAIKAQMLERPAIVPLVKEFVDGRKVPSVSELNKADQSALMDELAKAATRSES